MLNVSEILNSEQANILFSMVLFPKQSLPFNYTCLLEVIKQNH